LQFVTFFFFKYYRHASLQWRIDHEICKIEGNQRMHLLLYQHMFIGMAFPKPAIITYDQQAHPKKNRHRPATKKTPGICQTIYNRLSELGVVATEPKDYGMDLKLHAGRSLCLLLYFQVIAMVGPMSCGHLLSG
jgi:hypothetical protein